MQVVRSPMRHLSFNFTVNAYVEKAMANLMDGQLNMKNKLIKKDEQLKRWNISDTNKESDTPRNAKRIKFHDGVMFLAACSSGDIGEVQRLLSSGANINTADVDGITALHQACIDNNMKIIELMVENGANVNVCDNEGWTPLHATASCGFIDLAKYLLDHGARLDAVNNDGDLPLDVAEGQKMKAFLTDLMQKRGIDGAKAKAAEEQLMMQDANHWINNGNYEEKPHPKTGAYGLHIAAAKGYVQVIKLLLQAGASIDARDVDGWTPMHAAAHWGQEESCRLLAEHMANMTALNSAGQTPIDVAAPELKDVLEELQKKQESMSAVSSDIMRPTLAGTRRSSIIRISTELKKDLITKTADKDVGMLRPASVDEEEAFKSDEDENERDSERDRGSDPSIKTSSDTDEPNRKHAETSQVKSSALEPASDDVAPLLAKPVVPAASRLKKLTIEPLEDELLPVSKRRQADQGLAGARDKAVSLESITNRFSSSELKPASSNLSEVSRTSSELIRNAAGGSDRSLSDQNSHSAQQSHSTSKDAPKDANQAGTTVTGPTMSEIKIPATRAASIPLTVPSVVSSRILSQHGLLSRQGIHSSLRDRLNELARQQQITDWSSSLVPIGRQKIYSSLDRIVDTVVSSDARLQRSASCCLRSSPSEDLSSAGSSSYTGQDALQKRPYTSIFAAPESGRPSSLVGTPSSLTTSPAAPSSVLSTRASSLDIAAPAATTPSSSSSSELLRHRSPQADQPAISATIAALSSTTDAPRRSFDIPKQDDEKEVERKARAKRQRESRRSTQGVSKEDLARAELALQAADSSSSQSLPIESDPSSTASSSSLGDTESTGNDKTRDKLTDLTNTVQDVAETKHLYSKRTSQLAEGHSTTPVSSHHVHASSSAPVTAAATSTVTTSSQSTTTATTTQAAVSSVPSYSRTSSYRSKYLQEREQEEAARKKDVVSQPDETSASKGNDLGNRSIASRARRKRDTRRSTGRVLPEDTQGIASDEDSKESGAENVEEMPTETEPIIPSARQQSSSSSSTGVSEINYKLLYEAERAANEVLRREKRQLEQEVTRVKIDFETALSAKSSVRHTSDGKIPLAALLEKQTMEKKIADLEEQLKACETLKDDNKRLRDENGALIRVISKLSK